MGGGQDFLKTTRKFPGSIITNPPYNLATEFILKALDCISKGHHVYMFLKLTALEGQKRYTSIYSKYPPKKIYVFTKRLFCGKKGEFERQQSSAIAYAWFIWEKGYTGLPAIDWI